MPKKEGVKKKRAKKNRVEKRRGTKIESVLIENLVSLQKVMTHMLLKFDNLSEQISKLLELFEISAKTLAQKDFNLEKSEGDLKIIEKLDALLDQNKVIARGLTLLHEPEEFEPQRSYPPMQRALQDRLKPQFQRPVTTIPQSTNKEDYQRSISLEKEDAQPKSNSQFQGSPENQQEGSNSENA